MGCCGKFLVKVFAFLLNLFKLGGAIAIICIVAIHLVNVEFYEIFEYECLLGAWEGKNLCDFAFVIAAVSIGVEAAVFILLCCTCNLCGLGYIIETIFMGFGSMLWLAASLVFTDNVMHANNTIDGDSQFEKWRTAVLGLSWAIFGAFVILFFVYLFKMLAPVCPCLNCCDDDDKNRVHP
mmetsp:Transcript_7924/g.23885  ORF Transcript_7924/g.23885 Transcript_7924/m.23885 type:complete len:180 (-) Transcript_7924:1586-2125(-)